jgi:hypothetical protein
VTGHFDGGLRMWDVRTGKRIVEEVGLHDSKAGGICSVAAGSLGGECSYKLHLCLHLVSIMLNFYGWLCSCWSLVCPASHRQLNK